LLYITTKKEYNFRESGGWVEPWKEQIMNPIIFFVIVFVVLGIVAIGRGFWFYTTKSTIAGRGTGSYLVILGVFFLALGAGTALLLIA
jgi:hypothetical protein